MFARNFKKNLEISSYSVAFSEYIHELYAFLKTILTSVRGRLDYGSHFDIINIYVGVGGSFLLHFVKGCREDQFVGYYMSRNNVGYDKFLFQILYLE